MVSLTTLKVTIQRQQKGKKIRRVYNCLLRCCTLFLPSRTRIVLHPASSSRAKDKEDQIRCWLHPSWMLRIRWVSWAVSPDDRIRLRLVLLTGSSMSCMDGAS